MKICGIYGILNRKNNKIYIGKSKNIIQRWRCHKHLLKYNKHENHLQRAWYLDKNYFNYVIIEECDEKILSYRESVYIKIFKSHNPNYGYNTLTYDENINIVYSEETKNKMSLIIKGKFLGKNNPRYGIPCPKNVIEATIKSNSRTYTIMSPTGELIEFTGLKKFCKKYNLDRKSLYLVFNNKQKHHKGWTKPKQNL
jgi:group I intron endonuclease